MLESVRTYFFKEGDPQCSYLQVAVSLAGCIYLLNYRLKSIGRSFILGYALMLDFSTLYVSNQLRIISDA